MFGVPFNTLTYIPGSWLPGIYKYGFEAKTQASLFCYHTYQVPGMYSHGFCALYSMCKTIDQFHAQPGRLLFCPISDASILLFCRLRSHISYQVPGIRYDRKNLATPKPTGQQQSIPKVYECTRSCLTTGACYNNVPATWYTSTKQNT